MLPLKDSTSDMAVIARKGSDLVKQVGVRGEQCCTDTVVTRLAGDMYILQCSVAVGHGHHAGSSCWSDGCQSNA